MSEETKIKSKVIKFDKIRTEGKTGKKIGSVSMLQSQADVLNKQSKNIGISYKESK